MKIHELKQELADLGKELEAMAGKTDDEGFRKELYEAVKEKIEEGEKRLGRMEEAKRIASGMATRVDGQPNTGFDVPLRAMNGRPKYFKDLSINGRTVSANEQAYAAGQFFLATIYGRNSASDWCKSNGMPLVKAQGEGTDQYGGYLVPELLMNNIIILREEYGVFRQRALVVPMGTDSQNWPRRVGGVTAYHVGENTQITESQANWDNVNLVPKKVATLIRMSTELNEDAIIAVGDYLTNEIAYAFALQEDNDGFNGDGTSTYGGIRGTTWLASNAAGKGGKTGGNYTTSSGTLTSLAIKDLTGTMGMLPQYAIKNAEWYMSQQVFYSSVASITAAAGGNRLDVLTQGIEKRLLGFPVVIAQVLNTWTPASSVGTGNIQYHFGDLSKAAMMGDRRGVTIMRSDHRYFENDQIGLRGTERFDIVVHDIGVSPSQSTNVPGSPLASAQSP